MTQKDTMKDQVLEKLCSAIWNEACQRDQRAQTHDVMTHVDDVIKDIVTAGKVAYEIAESFNIHSHEISESTEYGRRIVSQTQSPEDKISIEKICDTYCGA